MMSIPSRSSAAIALFVAAATATAQDTDLLRRDVEFAKAKVYPALVNISVVSRDYSGGRLQRSMSAGSGVIVSPAGHVLTNYHVAGESTHITCTLPTGEVVPAEVITDDPLTDLSVLRLKMGARDDPSRPLPFATLGQSADLEVGDPVLAMGNPLTLSSSMTLGIVSNTKRVFTDFGATDMDVLDLGDGEKTGLFTRWLQHDALIMPGNSGGPLVNMRGEVVGINELGGGGVGFAIPSDLAAQVLSQALTYGEVRRAWLGLNVLPVRKLGRDTGALVDWVAPETPAEAAGLRAGDILLDLGGEPVDVRFFEQVPLFYQRIAQMEPGTEVPLRFLRDGDEKQATVTLARMAKFLGEPGAFPRAGATARSITPPMALARHFPDDRGLLITGVRPGYPFAEAKPELQAGDVLLAIGDDRIDTLDQLEGALEGAKGDVTVRFRRDMENIVTVVDMKRDENEFHGRELPKPWLGIETQVLTPKVAKALGHEGAEGFRVTRVLPTTPAEKAGVRLGDLIVALDGDELDASRPQDAQDLRRAIEDRIIGETVDLAVLRGDERKDLEVTLEESPASALDVDKAENERFEFAVREITFMDRVRFHWPQDAQGLLVTQVESGSVANLGGLHVDDLIVEIQGKPVHAVDEFEAAMDEVAKQEPDVVRLFVRRQHRSHFVFLEPEWGADGADSGSAPDNDNGQQKDDR